MLFSLEKTRVKPGTVLIETVFSGDSLYCHLDGCGSICGPKPKTVLLTTVLVAFFLYFNLKQKTVFTNNVSHMYIGFQSDFFCNFEPSRYVIKRVLLRRELIKVTTTILVGFMPSLLTTRMTIPFNKAPCLMQSLFVTPL